MTMFDNSAAAESIASLTLERSNLELAMYWLSLWQDGALPARSAFHPAKLKQHLPNIIMFNVVPDVSVTVRLAGTRYNHILGAELTGKDWIAAASAHHRAVRLGLFSTLARGAILLDHRLLAMAVGEDIVCEEIILPFAQDASGVYPVMAHVNLQSTQYLRIRSMTEAIAEPIDFKVVPLKKLALAA